MPALHQYGMALNYSDEKTRFFKKSPIFEETPPKWCIRFSHYEFNLLSHTFQCYYVKILVFHSIRHFWYVASTLIRESLERGLMMSLTQQLARCYLSKQRKTCPRVKLRLLSIMIYQLRSYSLTSKNIQSHLWLQRFSLMATEKKQPHIDGKELKRKNKRNAARSFELTEIKWYFGVVILSVYYCSLHL